MHCWQRTFIILKPFQAFWQPQKLKNKPIILQLSESSIEDLGLDVGATMAREALKEYGVEGWLHLDHGSSIEVVHRCLDAGFDSVMIDASEKPFSENVKLTAEVVRLASQYNANVEAELGYIAKAWTGKQHSIYTAN